MKLLHFVFAASATFAPIAMAGQLQDVPFCPGVGKPKTVLSSASTLEAAAFDGEGHLILSNWLGNKLYQLQSPQGRLQVAKKFVWAPGGLVPMPDGTLLVGSGIDSLALLAPRYGFARIYQVDLRTSEKSVYASGISMGNGLVRAPDGTVFASNDLAPALDRIDPDGTVHRGWYRESPANGLAIANDGNTLFANVSLDQTRIMAIDPVTAEAHIHFQPPAGLEWVFFDDLEIDTQDRLYVPLYFGGQVWRIDSDGSFCALAKGLLLPAGITLGVDANGFSSHSVYVTTHLGKLIEIPDAVPTTSNVDGQ